MDPPPPCEILERTLVQRPAVSSIPTRSRQLHMATIASADSVINRSTHTINMVRPATNQLSYIAISKRNTLYLSHLLLAFIGCCNQPNGHDFIASEVGEYLLTYKEVNM